MGQRRAFSVSIYCRHEGAVLLVLHKRLKAWLPIGGEMKPGETPIEAARREIREEIGHEEATFPAIHNVTGAPPGLLLYEEHISGDKGLHMNFAFLAEVENKRVIPCSEFTGTIWVAGPDDMPHETPTNVREAVPFALAAGKQNLA